MSLERLALTLDGQVFSPGAARLAQVDPPPKPQLLHSLLREVWPTSDGMTSASVVA